MTDESKNESRDSEANSKVFESLLLASSKAQELTMDIAVVRRDLDHISNQVASIENTLHKGNGRESIMTRIYSVENHLGGIQRTLSEQGRLENQRRWQLWMAVVVAALSAAGNWIPKVI